MELINLSPRLYNTQLVPLKDLPIEFLLLLEWECTTYSSLLVLLYFNFKKVAFNRDVDQSSADPSSIAYSCEYSLSKDCYHGHRLTADLRIIEDNKIRKIFQKGL